MTLERFLITRSEKAKVTVTFLVLVVAITEWGRSGNMDLTPWWLRLAILATFLVLLRFFVLGKQGTNQGDAKVGVVFLMFGLPGCWLLGFWALGLFLMPPPGT